MKMEETKCSETSAYKIQTPGNNPEENIHHNINMFAYRFVWELLFWWIFNHKWGNVIYWCCSTWHFDWFYVSIF